MKVKDVYNVARLTKDAHIVVADKQGKEYPTLSVLKADVLKIRKFKNLFFLLIDKQDK